jgi:hypothetical protein
MIYPTACSVLTKGHIIRLSLLMSFQWLQKSCAIIVWIDFKRFISRSRCYFIAIFSLIHRMSILDIDRIGKYTKLFECLDIYRKICSWFDKAMSVMDLLESKHMNISKVNYLLLRSCLITNTLHTKITTKAIHANAGIVTYSNIFQSISVHGFPGSQVKTLSELIYWIA